MNYYKFDILIVLKDYLYISAANWIWNSLAEGFRENGFKCEIISYELLNKYFDHSKKFILILDIAMVKLEDPKIFSLIKQFSIKGSYVLSNIFKPYNALPSKRINNLTELLKKNHIKFLFGEQEENLAEELNLEFFNKYNIIASSVSTSTLNTAYDLPYEEKYDYDVVFIGAKLPKKRWFNENIIPEVKSRYKCLIKGHGWKKRHYIIKIINLISKVFKNNSINKISQVFYSIISESDEIKIYRNSKVVLNFHEREKDNSKVHRIVNQRLFKLAACGCRQIVDKDSVIDKYYDDDQVIQLPLNKELWLKKIDELVKRNRSEIEKERKSIIKHTELHSSKARAAQLLKILECECIKSK